MSLKPAPSRARPGIDNSFKVVSTLDLVILLDNLCRGAADPEVGFEDCEQTLAEITSKLHWLTRLKKHDLESALWVCNLLSEKKTFWHPRGYTFDQWTRLLLKGDSFDKDYNLIIDRPKNPK